MSSNKPRKLKGNPPAVKENDPVLSDERVQEKIKEYELRIAATEDEQKMMQDALNAEYQKKMAEVNAEKEKITQKLEEIKEKETAILKKEQELDTQKKQIKADVINEIRANEREIREKEYISLQQKWEQEASAKRKTLDDELVAQRKFTAQEFEHAHRLRVAAEKEKLSRIHQADSEIQEKYKNLTDEYQGKMTKLHEAIKKFQQEKEEYEYNLTELKGDREYVQALQQRYEGCSEKEVKLLQLKIQSLEEVNRASQEQISIQSKKIAQLEVRALDRSGQTAQERIDNLERQLEEANSQLDEYVNFPSKSRVLELQQIEEMYKTQCQELDEIKAQLVTSQARLSAYALDKRELENARTIATALQSLNEQLQKKLQFITEQYKSSHESKFQGLLEIDAEKYIPSERENFHGTLAELVTYIRNFGANPPVGQTPLYYSEETIRVFLASLAASESASRLIILQGLSGTGKSSLPQLFRKALDIRWYSISVQPSWRDNRELLGYDNDFTNRFKETEFTKVLYRASSGNYKDDIVFIVLDEMNLARIEYYFADFLSVLEHKDADWKIPLVSSFSEPNEEQRPKWLNYDNGTANIIIKRNIWFIGTANNDDSTSLITDKVYDRAQILDMDERETPFECKKVRPVTIDFGTLSSMFAKARRKKEYQMTKDDWSILNDIDQNILQRMDITFGNRMKNQLDDFVPIYIACGGTKEGAIDYFLAHKILRKLDEKYDAYVAGYLDELIEALNTYYGEDVFVKCIKKIATIKHRNFNIGDI